MGAKHAPLAERFWRYVKKTDTCWLWVGAKGGGGRYGSIHLDDHPYKSMLAHRASWLIHFGDTGKHCILHRCDNTFCVRPDHLFLGSQLDNIQDMCHKKRQAGPKGEAARHAKLTEDSVLEIRRLYRTGCQVKDLARIFGVGRCQIWMITTRRNWTHI